MRKGLTGARSLCAIALISGAVFGAAADAQAAAPPPAGAVVSPDGKRAAWVGDGGKSVWNETRASASAEWRDPERLLAIRGTVGKLVFSPDSTQLAFENPRGDHAFIAVYDLKANKLGYADPSFGSDSAPSWSADGKQLSFVRSYGGAAVPVTAPAPSFGPWIDRRPGTDDTFKVADILQAPISYGPEASGDGRSVAYITREATTRAIYFMRSGTPSRRVVNYPDDDGRELSAARRLTRRRRHRLRARQLAQQRRRDPQPGLGCRHAASPRLRRPVARRRAADARRRAGARLHAGRQDARLGQRHERDERLAHV